MCLTGTNCAGSLAFMDLKAYRDAHNLTASEMGRMLDVEHSTVLRIEQGKREPSAEMLRRIVRVTGGAVTADDVLGIGRNT